MPIFYQIQVQNQQPERFALALCLPAGFLGKSTDESVLVPADTCVSIDAAASVIAKGKVFC